MTRIFLAFFLATVALPARADTTMTTPTALVWSLLRNGSNIGAGYATKELCEAKISVDSELQATVGPTTYFCQGRETIIATYKKPETPPPYTPPTTPPAMPDMPVHGGLDVDMTTIPAGDPGVDHDLVVPYDDSGLPADIGAFRTNCYYSHFAFDDSIVYPGKPGVAHGHVFFGNTGSNAFSTYDSLLATGNSTCFGGTANKTSYWAPGMADFPNGDFTAKGQLVKPDGLQIYYKQGYNGVQAKDIKVIPPGLVIIAGDPTATTPFASAGRWSCTLDDGTESGWAGNIPANCMPGKDLLMNMDFPQCWDGVNLDSPDHKSHMAYANSKYITQAQLDAQIANPATSTWPGFQGSGLQWWQSLTTTTACPADHPVALPLISTGLFYKVPPTGTKNWALLSDGYKKLHPEMPSGYSEHFDYKFAWKPEIIKTWTELCDVAQKDCHSNLLGDGRLMLDLH